MGGEGAVFRSAWPVADAELARESEIEIPVQINGKLVTVVKVPAGSDEATIKAAALADAKVVARIAGKTVVKVIVVPGQACECCGEVVETRRVMKRGRIAAVRGTQSFVHTLSAVLEAAFADCAGGGCGAGCLGRRRRR